MFRKAVLILMIAALAIPIAFAAGGSSVPSTPEPSTTDEKPQKTLEEQAIDHYNWGIGYRDKAWKVEEKMAAAEGKEQAKLENKVAKLYKRAIQEFELATEKNPSMHQAWSSLGYGLRKTGQYERSLEAYDRSLELSPDYAEAIEYRAEAYLGLNRIDEAKAAYIQLFGSDRERADELMAAMKKWLESRRAEPAGVDAGTLDAFAGWVAEREKLAGQTASVSQLRERDW